MELPEGFKCWTELYTNIKNKHLDHERQVSIVIKNDGVDHSNSVNINVSEIKTKCLDEIFDLQFSESELNLLKTKFAKKADGDSANILTKADQLLELCHT